MKLSTRGQYATRALLDIALHPENGSVFLGDIARRQQISPWYLKRLITPLIVGGLVRSTRGAKGGVPLAKPATEIQLSAIIELVEGSIAPVECVINPGVCSRSASCVTRDVWGDLKKAMDGVLENTSVQDLVERHKQKEQSQELMYHI